MSNSISVSRHPTYAEAALDWQQMRHSYAGQRTVKAQGVRYLPPTDSHVQDGFGTSVNTAGHKAYAAYIMRARFPNFVSEAIEMAVGMMHNQPPQIKLPKAMEKIVSSKGEDLPTLLRRINTEQLLTGRIGLMADLAEKPEIGKDLPYLTTYTAERIVNWDAEGIPEELQIVVLNESGNVRSNGLEWTTEDKYRVLTLETGVYRQGVFTNGPYDVSLTKELTWRGQTLEKIPFVIINAVDLASEVGEVPLMDLSEMCMTIYRGDADYRQNLFMQGQDTFVTIGGNFDEGDAIRTGAGARIDLPLGADAKFVGVTSSGLAEQRQAQENLEKRAGTMGAQTLDSTSRERESGSSLRIRVAARTADMNQIADAGALGLQDSLRACAVWMDEDPSEVSVIPNKEFGEAELTGQSMVEMQTARNLGFPVSARSLHEYAFKRKLTNRTFEEEMAEAKKEEKENHPFAKSDSGDSAPIQPNQKPEGDLKAN